MGRLKMKTIVYLTITLALIAGAFTSHSFVNEVMDKMSTKPQKELFKAFHYLHKKTYNLNSEEALKRYKIFKQNVQWIKEENTKLDKQVYGITQFSDLTHEEFVEKHLMKPEVFQATINEMEKKSGRFLQEEEHIHTHQHYHDDGEDEYEDEHEIIKGNDHNLRDSDIDHRNFDANVKNQGGCGSCWAFAAIGAIENNYHQLTGNLTLFSEQYLVDCDNQDNGCNGGWPSSTFNWIGANGVFEDSVSTYRGSQVYCNENLKSNEYKIVTGAGMFNGKRDPQSKWTSQLAKG